METLQIYWLAFKYWAGCTPWDKALETATSIVKGWKSYHAEAKRRLN